MFSAVDFKAGLWNSPGRFRITLALATRMRALRFATMGAEVLGFRALAARLGAGE